MLKALGVGRFQVMALLQAARYYVLYKDLGKAKSFGLNRAIFYAWAKYYGKRSGIWRYYRSVLERPKIKEHKVKCPEGFVEVAGECVQTSPRGYFMIGDQEQTPIDFDQQVMKKISFVIDPDKVWRIVLDYVKEFPEYVLKDPQKFFKYVYEPIRDEFFKQVIEKGKIEAPKNILEKLKSFEEMLKKAKTAQKDLEEFFK
ncbi:MAG: hypothetical protein DRO40_01750 [Thermoprotei archaeon]|nr:MAG: hypothetical protein DRO40_01750 [Thermoprotei archaeon]